MARRKSVLRGDPFGTELSPREMEVMRLHLDLDTDKEVAAQLGITTQTVKNHLISVRLRLGVHSLLAAYRKLGWIVPADEWPQVRTEQQVAAGFLMVEWLRLQADRLEMDLQLPPVPSPVSPGEAPEIAAFRARQDDPLNCSNCGEPLATHTECGEFG